MLRWRDVLSSDMIRGILDPEHPRTLEELNVLEESKVEVIAVINVFLTIFYFTIHQFSSTTMS